jgi:hypothetical protein
MRRNGSARFRPHHVSLFSRAFPGTVAATDETGFCFLSDDMLTDLREITRSAMP